MRIPRLLLVPALAVTVLLSPAMAQAETPLPEPSAGATTTVNVQPAARAPQQATPDAPAPGTAPDVQLGDGQIPSGKHGANVNVVVPLINRGDAAATEVLVTAKPSVNAANFPFEITRTDYTVDAGTLAPGASGTANLGTLKLRSGLKTGYYALPLSIQYSAGAERQVVEKTIFVHVDGVAEAAPDKPAPVTTQPPQTIEVVVTQPEVPAGGGGGGPIVDYGPIDSGGGGVVPGGDSGTTATGSQPRVMLTRFTTNPTEVLAGQSFKLAFALKNMSSRTAVGNIKVTVSAAESSFLPVNGASSVFIDSIGAEQTASRELEFRALPTLEEQPYQLTVRIEYEDSSTYAPLTAEEAIAVVVRQNARAETGTIQVLPEIIEVGQDANISFPVQNKGKVRLFNTRAIVKPGQAVSGTEVFVGNIEPGASGNVDMMVHGDKVNDKPIVIQVIYEDAAGVESSFEREVNLEVTPEQGEMTEQGTEDTPNPMAGAMLPLMVGALILIGAIVAGYVWSQRRKKAKEAELAAGLEALDDEPLFPVDPE